MTYPHFSRRFILAVGAAALLGPQVSSADILEKFDFGIAPPSLLTPTTVGAGVSPTPIAAGAGVTLDVNSNQGNPPASSPWLRIVPIAANTTPAAAVTADARFFFSLTTLPGFTMDLTSLDFNAIKGGTGTRGYAVQTSVGQIGAGPWTADIPTNRGQTLNGVLSPWTPVSISLADAAYQDLSAITFSIYSYSGGGGSSVEYDDIVVNGAVTFGGYTWTGATGAWNTSATNWTGAGTVYVDATANSNVLFDDTATVTNVAVAAGGLSPNTVYISNNTKEYGFSGGSLNVTGTLHKSGTGTATINNTVTAPSVQTVSGTLAVGNGGTLNSASVDVSGGARLSVNEGGSLAAATALNLAGTFLVEDNLVKITALNGPASGVVQLDPNDFEAPGKLEITGGGTFAGKITGFGSLLKSGTDTLVLSGANDFAGGLNITGGAVQITNAGGAGLNGATVNAGGTLVLGANLASAINLNGGALGVSAASTLPLNTTVTVSEDSVVSTFNPVTGQTSNDLIFLGTLTGSGDITLQTLNGNTPDSFAFRLRGPASDYSGTITVPQSGKFELQTSAAAGSPMGTGTLVMTAGTTTDTIQGTYSLLNVRNNNAAGNTTFGNNVRIQGTGAAYFNLLGAPETPAGAESKFGDLLVGDGQTVGAVATGTAGFTVAFETVHLTGGNATFAPRPVGQTGFNSTQNIRLGTVTQNVAGSGITVNGVGTVTISGASNYTGPTIVTNGTLAVDGSITGSAVTVNGGALSGAGTVQDVTIAGGALAPGKGIGALNTGNLIFDSGILAIQIGGATAGLYDQVNVTGGVTLNAPVALTLDFSAYDPVDSTDKFTLISNNLTDAIVFGSDAARFTFGGVPLNEGSIFTATSGAFTQSFEITYKGGLDGNDVVLMAAVPEPATAVTLLGGVAMLGAMRRRRRTC